MPSSTVLEVAIGLIFCYASMAIIASSVYEAIASLMKLRARSLLDGVKALLNDQQFTGLARAIYDHALVNPRGDPAGANGGGNRGNVEKGGGIRPSYIEPSYFAMALIDSIQKVPGDLQQLKQGIDALPDGQIRFLLQGMYTRAGGRIEDMHAAVAEWFDAGMDRVSGGYKRQAQLITFLIALVLAGLFNVDTFHLFGSLWRHPALVAQLGAPPAAHDTMSALQSLEMLPVGWATPVTCRPTAILGWVVTASSALFGAPFWFDLLQRVVNLRSTGQKPGEKKAEK